jgi:hypothetical protein|tara:strand:- start:2 stop:187 length:186 start_codon:yes stop_codon:yes gene_type:complete
VAATVGPAAAGTLYGVLAAGPVVRDTLVHGDAWSRYGMRAVFAVIYTMLGMTFFGTLLEET